MRVQRKFLQDLEPCCFKDQHLSKRIRETEHYETLFANSYLSFIHLFLGISPHPKLRHDYGGDGIILAAGAQDPSTVSDKYE